LTPLEDYSERIDEMKYNFDLVINRKNTMSRKWDPEILKERFGRSDLLPFWVADMDFRVAKPIEDAIIERAKHPIYGYSIRKESYYDSIKSWMKNQFDYEIKKEWIVYTPGVVSAIAYALQAFSDEDDNILIQTPVYPKFEEIIKDNNRRVLNSPLNFDGERYNIDFNDFESKIKDNDVKIFILCSPHNPIGRVWSKEELEKIGKICLKYNVLVISDEIHNDFVYKNHKHNIFSSISKEFANNSIICTSTSKTFNLAGLEAANIIIPNKKNRVKFENILEINKVGSQNPLSIVGVEAAYRDGSEWLDQIMDYIESNLKFIEEFLSENLPKANLIKPQATYLAWIDLREYEDDEKELEKIIINQAKIAPNFGDWFGEGGKGFIRFNFACSRQVLEEGLKRLDKALN